METPKPTVADPKIAELEQKLKAEVEKAAKLQQELATEQEKAKHVAPLAHHSVTNPVIANNAETHRKDEISQLEAKLAALKTAVPTKKAVPTGDKVLCANLRLKLDKDNDIPLEGVTPAEVLYLVCDHHINVKDNPIHAIELIDDGAVVETGVKDGVIQRRYVTDAEILSRLRTKYPARKVKLVYAGASPRLPKTFDEAIKAGVEFAMPQDKLGSFQFGH